MTQPSSGAAAPRGPVALVVSPHGGRARGSDARTLLNDAGVSVALDVTVDKLDQLTPAGRQWQARGIVAAVAAGGDGTIGAVATQIAPSDLPLGILPLGTSNDVARALGIPLELARAAEVVALGTPQPVEAGICTPAQTEPRALSTRLRSAVGKALRAPLAERGAYFLHALTLGLNVEFARLATDIARRRRFGPLNYAAAALEAVARMQAQPMTLHLSGVVRTSAGAAPPDATGALSVTYHALQVAVVNLPTFGGALGLRLPDVRTDDGVLDVVVLEAPRDVDIGAQVERWLAAHRRLPENDAPQPPRPEPATPEPAPGPEMPAEDLFSLPGVLRYQARNLVVETPAPMDVTLDGELRARTPVDVRVAPRPLRVILPAKEANE